MSEAIESLLAEGRTFPPPSEFKQHAQIVDAEIYDEANVDFEGFWARQAEDLIDWDEARTGTRREASYFGIWSFATKYGNAFTGFAALQVLEQVGYAPGVPQSETVKTWMLWMYSWFPAACYLLAGLALTRFTFDRRALDEAQRTTGRGRS